MDDDEYLTENDFHENEQRSISSRRNALHLRFGKTSEDSCSPAPDTADVELFSPVTCLTLDLNSLHTYSALTPKRKLSLSADGTPTPIRAPVRPFFLKRLESKKSDAGVCLDSPSPLDTPTREQRFQDLLKRSSETDVNGNKNQPPLLCRSGQNHGSAFRRFNSLPLHQIQNPGRELIPTELEPERPTFFIGAPPPDEDSQDSGIGDLKERKDDFQFVKPTSIPPRRHRPPSTDSLGSPRSPMGSPNTFTIYANEDSCSPRRYSPFKGGRPISAPAGSLSFLPSLPRSPEVIQEDSSPTLLKTSSLTSSMDDGEGDDGFLDIFQQVESPVASSLPNSMSGLFHAPLLDPDNVQDKENTFRRPSGGARALFRSPSMPCNMDRSDEYGIIRRRTNFKRPEPPRDQNTPVQNKRRRSVMSASKTDSPVGKTNLKRSQSLSFSEDTIKDALMRVHSDTDLIGDTSKAFCLPTIRGQHQDLKSITPQTVVDLLQGAYNRVIEKFVIIDCRYPYEYNGGHIKDAQNIYTKEEIVTRFMDSPMTTDDPAKRNVLIFHCEFSSERAPKMSRFLRAQDRTTNKECYPALHYPELYLLDKGYKHFFEQQQIFCEPQSYKPMLHDDHGEDLKMFRAKSKSWAGERSRLSQRVGLK